MRKATLLIRRAIRNTAAAALFGLAASTARAQPAAPAVLVATAEMHEVSPAVEFVGRVKAVDRVDLRARVTGFLGTRKFTEGDEVKTDQVLFSIDPAPFEAAVAQRRAAISAAEASVNLADVQAQRGRELARSGNLPKAQLDEREANLLRAKADLEMAQAMLREAEINLSYTQIQSPVAGRVGEAAASPGNLVGPDSGVLATVVRQDPIHVSFNVSQRQLITVQREAKLDVSSIVARLRLADGSAYEEAGKIDFLGVQADSRTDSVPARAVFPNPKRILVDGMSVRVVLEASRPEQALVIPQTAVSIDQAGAYVLTVDADNKAALRRVRTETRRDGTAVVREGLAAGERVIVQGQARVRPGMVVAPSPMQTGS